MNEYGAGSDEAQAGPALVKSDFALGTLEDELRVDELCRHLLQQFYGQLLADDLSPEAATLLANSADYYVRDFLVAIKQCDLFAERPGLVRQFAGNWYIVSTLEPTMEELACHLEGVTSFYRYLHGSGLISAGFLASVEGECADRAYYDARITSFWGISGDGYLLWERHCTLKDG